VGVPGRQRIGRRALGAALDGLQGLILRDNQGENARQRVTWTPLRGSLRIREVGVPS